jgi:hypothetical protein
MNLCITYMKITAVSLQIKGGESHFCWHDHDDFMATPAMISVVAEQVERLDNTSSQQWYVSVDVNFLLAVVATGQDFQATFFFHRILTIAQQNTWNEWRLY